MAEGGIMEFDNPTFDEEDYNIDEQETSFENEQQFQTILNTKYETLQEFTGETREKEMNDLTILLQKKFYERNQEPMRDNNSKWYVKEDDRGRPLIVVSDYNKEYKLSFYRGNNPDALIQFYSFDTLQNKYGVSFVRDILGVDDYSSSSTRLKYGRAEFQKLIESGNKIDSQNIPMKDISSPQEVQDLINTVDEVETATNEIETSFIETPTQTDMTKREMDGILKAMTSVKEEIANELGKLNETNKDLAYEKEKLERAKADNDEFQIERISSRIRDLEIERSSRLEVININRDRLRSQVNRIKETIHKILREDTTLGERIRTLFREQGITIVSILTAFGMIIGVIVESIIPTSGGGGGTITPKPPPKGGDVKDWIKKQLSNLGKLLAKLAGKAAEALPGIIGAIVSWLLSATGKVVNWFGEHLWAIVVLVVGLLYTAAREFFRNTHK